MKLNTINCYLLVLSAALLFYSCADMTTDSSEDNNFKECTVQLGNFWLYSFNTLDVTEENGLRYYIEYYDSTLYNDEINTVQNFLNPEKITNGIKFVRYAVNLSEIKIIFNQNQTLKVTMNCTKWSDCSNYFGIWKIQTKDIPYVKVDKRIIANLTGLEVNDKLVSISYQARTDLTLKGEKNIQDTTSTGFKITDNSFLKFELK